MAMLPPKIGTIRLTESIIFHLFPFFNGGKKVRISSRKLTKQLVKLLKSVEHNLLFGKSDTCHKFIESLKEIKIQLQLDAQFMEKNDPAATCVEEVVMNYPGFFAIATYRIAHQLHLLGVPIIPRTMTEYAHSKTGIDIHPGATIGKEFFIDHGTGIVIGESAIIGNRVKLYQGVTIGALSISKTLAAQKRHPTLEDNVVVYAGATILGGETIIGHNSIIGGNVWLTRNVQAFSIVQRDDKVKVSQQTNRQPATLAV